MTGIFISKGMSLSIPDFTLTIGEDGQINASPITIHVRFDVCPTWIKLAKNHLDDALKARLKRDEAWKGTDENEKATCLEKEFESSMQAITSAAIAIDSIYSILQEHVNIPPSLRDRWRKGRTARYSQISEVFRRAFKLEPDSTKQLKTILKEIYRFRDLAVHPKGKIQAPELHPELNVGVEWRFAYFRAHNAEKILNITADILWKLATAENVKHPKIVEYLNTLRQRLLEIYPNGSPMTEPSL